jgi:tRNA (cmo5U34)-methyltransferase
VTDTDTNRWTQPAWAQRYLAERDAIPHRSEGVAVLVELLPPAPHRVLDLGTGDGFLLGVVCAARPGVSGIACDFSERGAGYASALLTGIHAGRVFS